MTEANTRELRDEALDVLLACEASCICSSMAPQSRPCICTVAADMIRRLYMVLCAEARKHPEKVSA